MGGNAASKAMDKVKKGYQELCTRYKRSHLIHPYLWTRRDSGKLQRKVTIGDLVFVHKVNRIGKVIAIGRNPLKVYYKDTAAMAHEEWYSKASLALLDKGSQLTPQSFPEGLEDEVGPVWPERENYSEGMTIDAIKRKGFR